MMEVSVHVVCGVMHAGPIEYMPWVAAAFARPAIIEDGHMVPPPEPGLGLELAEDVVARYRVE
jgi:L-alanine-DL-glutamate epimerase-like enolase superfamily enzyme